jgi:hypothetical protein
MGLSERKRLNKYADETNWRVKNKLAIKYLHCQAVKLRQMSLQVLATFAFHGPISSQIPLIALDRRQFHCRRMRVALSLQFLASLKPFPTCKSEHPSRLHPSRMQ